MTCDDRFICAEEIHILSYEIVGLGWFFVMLIIAFALQWAANFIWIQNSQVTRELLQKPIKDRGTIISGYLGRSLMWTLISTLVWIARIILVMGSNLWIFIVVLIGNLWGVYYTQTRQKPDHQYLADDILLMLKRLDSDTCDDCVKSRIKEALQGLKTEMDKLDQQQPNTEDGRDSERQQLIAF